MKRRVVVSGPFTARPQDDGGWIIEAYEGSGALQMTGALLRGVLDVSALGILVEKMKAATAQARARELAQSSKST